MLYNEAELIFLLIKDLKDKTVLNICSSDERYYKQIQSHVWKFIHEPLIQNGNRFINLDMKAMDGVDIVNDCCDMKDVKDSSIGVALFFSGIEHILEPQKALDEIYRVLTGDGLLIASAPGVYPKHDDPIDTLLRMPQQENWERTLGNKWKVLDFKKSQSIPANPDYKFDQLVYATIVKAQKR